MKTLVLLVAGMIALVGSAAAYEETNSMQYSFQKTIEEIEGFTPMQGVLSGVYAYEPGTADHTDSCPMVVMGVRNMLVDSGSNSYLGGTTHQTLTQGAEATVTTRTLDSEDDKYELESYVAKNQDLTFSGQFRDYGATFADDASVGVNYLGDIRDPAGDRYSVSSCGNCHATEAMDAIATVTASGDAKISEGSLGTQTWTSLKADGWMHGATNTADTGGEASWTVMDGGSMVYSSFFGDTVVPVDDTITTYGTITTTHSWNKAGGWSNIPPS